MKNIYLFLIFLGGFCSCTSDSDLVIPKLESNYLAKESPIDYALDIRANSNNPYDIAGRMHNDILDAYYASSNPPSTVAGIINRVETIANNNAVFFAIEGDFYQQLSLGRMLYLLNNPIASRFDVLNNSVLSIKAKSSINTFIDQVLPICDSNAAYSAIYNFVSAYESTVLADVMLTENDKKIILTTTSLVRYSANRRKRPKKNTDLDWELNVTHLVGSIEGSSYGTSEAITTTLALGIANHN